MFTIAVKLANTYQITKSNYTVPKLVAGILLVLFGLGLFVVGSDQGHLFSLIEGTNAFNDLYLHELFLICDMQQVIRVTSDLI